MYKTETLLSTPRRRRRSSSTAGKTPSESGGDGRERLRYENDSVGICANRELAEAQASPRLWALLHEAQQEMERGTGILGDELSKLWQSLHNAKAGRESEGGIPASGAADCGGGGTAAAAVRTRVGGNRNGDLKDSGGDDGMNDKAAAAAPASKPRLHPEEADKLLAGLRELQAEMQAEAQSFQRRKSDIVKSLESQRGRRCSGRGAGDGEKDEIVRLEEEAESMKVAIVASRSRLLERVREVSFGTGKGREKRSVFVSLAPTRKCLINRRILSPVDIPYARDQLQRLVSEGVRSSAAAASASSATAASYHTISVPSARRTNEEGSETVTPGGSTHSLNDQMNAAQIMMAAREELEELEHQVEATREEVILRQNFSVFCGALCCHHTKPCVPLSLLRDQRCQSPQHLRERSKSCEFHRETCQVR